MRIPCSKVAYSRSTYDQRMQFWTQNGTQLPKCNSGLTNNYLRENTQANIACLKETKYSFNKTQLRNNVIRKPFSLCINYRNARENSKCEYIKHTNKSLFFMQHTTSFTLQFISFLNSDVFVQHQFTSISQIIRTQIKDLLAYPCSIVHVHLKSQNWCFSPTCPHQSSCRWLHHGGSWGYNQWAIS